MTGVGQECKMPDPFPVICDETGYIWKMTKKHHAGETEKRRGGVQAQELCRIVKRGIKKLKSGQ